MSIHPATRRTAWALSAFTAAILALDPGPVAAAARDLFVSSSQTNNVKRFDGETGAFLGNFMRNGAGGLSNTQECLFGPDGHMYVSAFQTPNVLKFHGATGAFLGPFSSGFPLSNATKMTYGPDSHLYVSQWGGTNRVVKFDAFTGAYLGDATSTGVVGGMGHAWDPAGNLYVAFWGTDGNDGGVQKFGPAGNFLGLFGQAGVMRGPVNLWFDTNGDLLVQDWTKGTIDRFAFPSGLSLGTFVNVQTRTEGWVYGPDGMLYVCDWLGDTVRRYEPDGTFDQVFASGSNLNTPNGVVFGLEHPVSAPSPEPLRNGDWLSQNAPNPFPGTTSIRFGLNQPGSVRLDIHDVRGRRVETVLQEVRGVGEHTVTWDAGTYPAGVYFYTLETPAGVETRRLTILR